MYPPEYSRIKEYSQNKVLAQQSADQPGSAEAPTPEAG
jgi:hypothetical protein